MPVESQGKELHFAGGTPDLMCILNDVSNGHLPKTQTSFFKLVAETTGSGIGLPGVKSCCTTYIEGTFDEFQNLSELPCPHF